MNAFLKGGGIILGLLIAGMIVAAVSPQAGMVVAAALVIAPIIALFKPIPFVGLNHRGFSAVVLFFVGLPMTLGVVGMNEQSSKLAALRQSDPAAYLAELKTTDQTKYLAELAVIDPERHKAELARIAEDEAKRVADLQAATDAKKAADEAAAQTRLAEEAARKAEAARSEVDQYLEQLDRELASMPGVSASKYTGTVDEINIGLILIGTWNLVYEKGASLSLDPDGQKKRQRFKEMLIRKQAEMFPVLRDAYGPAMRTQLWEADGSARTFGAGYRTVEFVSVAFAANANIKKIHTQIQEQLLMLRFTRAQYKWFSQASEFSYYTMEPPKDTNLGKWEAGGRFRVMN